MERDDSEWGSAGLVVPNEGAVDGETAIVVKRPLQLSPRLLALAQRIPPGCRVADIGTDHARLPIYLVQRGLVKHIIATDIREGPLSMAAEALAKRGLREAVELRLGRGAACLHPNEVDCVLIAGMGGDTIAEILRQDSWLSRKHLLLQPQTHSERVLDVLQEWGRRPETLEIWEKSRRYTAFDVPWEGYET